jgi:hypothetical protein
VVHHCHPSNSEGRDQDDHNSKPARANNSQEPISKIPITKKKKKRVVEWLKVKALSSSLSTIKKRTLAVLMAIFNKIKKI